MMTCIIKTVPLADAILDFQNRKIVAIKIDFWSSYRTKKQYDLAIVLDFLINKTIIYSTSACCILDAPRWPAIYHLMFNSLSWKICYIYVEAIASYLSH